jgi:ribosomal protein S12 methylthiotransferase
MPISSTINSSPRIGFISLGCPKALVDSERILTQLKIEGYQISSTFEQADLVIINTCGFINDAIQESLDTIGEAIEKNGRVIVTGCLGTQAHIIREAHPQVLAITGPNSQHELLTAIHSALPPSKIVSTANKFDKYLKLTPAHYAYIKIAEGCNHKCSFCIIPKLRGELISRSIDEVLTEAERLVQNGVKELLIIAQDTGAYGQDRKFRTEFYQHRPLRCDIITLATELGKLSAWIRLHYLYPYPQIDELVKLMATGHILPYLDMPLQHANVNILRAMRRPAATEKILDRINTWRNICPNLTLRSTFIVGFPGETESDFQELLDFLTIAKLDRVGCFTYSPVANAAANLLPNSVSEEIKQERYARFMETQRQISYAKLQAKIGQHMMVLVDKVYKHKIIARSSADAPDIDGVVIIKGKWELAPGDLVEVKITAASDHDLWGKPI